MAVDVVLYATKRMTDKQIDALYYSYCDSKILYTMLRRWKNSKKRLHKKADKIYNKYSKKHDLLWKEWVSKKHHYNIGESDKMTMENILVWNMIVDGKTIITNKLIAKIKIVKDDEYLINFLNKNKGNKLFVIGW